MKISEIIERIVRKQPFLEEALLYSFLNLTAFSEYIQPEIEKELGKNVSIHAIKMALSRLHLPQSLRTVSVYKGFKKVSTRKGLSLVTIVRSPKSLHIISQFLSETKKKSTHVFTVLEGLHEIDIIFESEQLPVIDALFPHALQVLRVEHLGLVGCELSDKEISTPGLFYQVTKRLAFHSINIIQVLSTYRELGILVAEQDLKNAAGLLMDV